MFFVLFFSTGQKSIDKQTRYFVIFSVVVFLNVLQKMFLLLLFPSFCVKLCSKWFNEQMRMIINVNKT